MKPAARLTARPATVNNGERLPPGVHHLRIGQHRRDALVAVPPGLQPGEPAAVALMLHGSGGDALQGASLLEPFAEEAHMLVLAPPSAEYTWDALLGNFGPDVAGIDELLHWAFGRFAVDRHRIAAGGFSDGASYALALALGNGDLFSHAIALSPGFVPEVRPVGEPRLFVAHGTRDAVLPVDRCSRRIVPALEAEGYPLLYREFDGGHVVPPGVAEAAVWWFSAGGAGEVAG